MTLGFLLRYHALTSNQEALEMVTETLRAMAREECNDHLGGGFHRYSVDQRWFVPHFEKMLYDQGQLAVSYLEAYPTDTATRRWRIRLAGIFEYVLRDMTDAEGGFYSAEDADSLEPGKDGHKVGGRFLRLVSRRRSNNDWTAAPPRCSLIAMACAPKATFSRTRTANSAARTFSPKSSPSRHRAGVPHAAWRRWRKLLREASQILFEARCQPPAPASG